MPVVVGMRARTTHCTAGKLSSRRGRAARLTALVSTGTDLAGRWSCDGSLVGVWMPGVVGGVKAGLSKLGGGGGDACCVRS